MVNESFFVLIRKQKKIDLKDFLRKNPDMELEKALAIFSLKTGLRLEKVKTYYEELKLAGQFEGT